MDTDKSAVAEHRVLRESACPGKLFPICGYLCSSVAKLLQDHQGIRLLLMAVWR
jgi:hypothetical protein